MKRLSGRSTEVEWPEQTALCAFSKHTVADGLFVEERTRLHREALRGQIVAMMQAAEPGN